MHVLLWHKRAGVSNSSDFSQGILAEQSGNVVTDLSPVFLILEYRHHREDSVVRRSVSPPEQVIAAFKDVASAKEDKNRMVNQAEGYRNDVIPKARGEAQARIREAEGYKQARIARAEGDVAKFSAILKEYRKAKGVTETRMYLETVEEVLQNKEKIIVPDGEGGGNLINLLNLKAKGDK